MLPNEYPYATNSNPVSTDHHTFKGNTELTLRQRPIPNLRIVDMATHLRVRPAELYLGAVMQRNQLDFFNFADLNVYDENTVCEWLEEVRDAAVHYLGQETVRSRL